MTSIIVWEARRKTGAGGSSGEVEARNRGEIYGVKKGEGHSGTEAEGKKTLAKKA